MNNFQILKNLQRSADISELNSMQKSVIDSCNNSLNDHIILSPTGSGKTIAFLFPALQLIDSNDCSVQAIVIAPSRELVIQIDNVARIMAADIKITACYGGHNVFDEKLSLSVTPQLIIATPGRILDHLNRSHIDISTCKLLILDEFDKSLELGFHDEMRKIIAHTKKSTRKILTSATRLKDIPDFTNLNNPLTLDFLIANKELKHRTSIIRINSPEKDKLNTLLLLLKHTIGNKRTIVFVNYRDAGMRTYRFLIEQNIPAGMYNGELDQIEREKAVEMFNNGSFTTLVSTDLGARGLDIENVESIIHYHMPITKDTFTHRNGRTARINNTGSVYVIAAPGENIPEYIHFDSTETIDTTSEKPLSPSMATLYFNAGKKEKLSKGDILGFLINKGGIEASDIGKINVHDHYSLAAISADKFTDTLSRISREKIKNKRILISKATQRLPME